MILPSDPLVVPQPGFRSDFIGWSDPTRSDRARYRIHRHGLAKSLELAYDNKTTTAIEQNGQLLLFVLDDVLKKQTVSNTKFTFNDCHLWP